MKVKNNCKLLLALLLSAGFAPSAVFATSGKPNDVVKEAFQRKNTISGKVTDANGEERQGQFYETIRLLDWGFDNFRRVTLAPEGTLVAKVKVNLSTQADEVNVKPQGEVTRTLPKDVDLDRVEMVPRLFSESVDAPVEAGQVLGTMVLSYEGTEYGTLDLVADTSVERSQLLYYKSQVEHFFQNSGVKLILAVVLIVGAVVLLRLLVFRRSRRYRAGMGAGRRGHYSGRRRR